MQPKVYTDAEHLRRLQSIYKNEIWNFTDDQLQSEDAWVQSEIKKYDDDAKSIFDATGEKHTKSMVEREARNKLPALQDEISERQAGMFRPNRGITIYGIESKEAKEEKDFKPTPNDRVYMTEIQKMSDEELLDELRKYEKEVEYYKTQIQFAPNPVGTLMDMLLEQLEARQRKVKMVKIEQERRHAAKQTDAPAPLKETKDKWDYKITPSEKAYLDHIRTLNEKEFDNELEKVGNAVEDYSQEMQKPNDATTKAKYKDLYEQWERKQIIIEEDQRRRRAERQAPSTDSKRSSTQVDTTSETENNNRQYAYKLVRVTDLELDNEIGLQLASKLQAEDHRDKTKDDTVRAQHQQAFDEADVKFQIASYIQEIRKGAVVDIDTRIRDEQTKPDTPDKARRIYILNLQRNELLFPRQTLTSAPTQPKMSSAPQLTFGPQKTIVARGLDEFRSLYAVPTLKPEDQIKANEAQTAIRQVKVNADRTNETVSRLVGPVSGISAMILVNKQSDSMVTRLGLASSSQADTGPFKIRALLESIDKKGAATLSLPPRDFNAKPPGTSGKLTVGRIGDNNNNQSYSIDQAWEQIQDSDINTAAEILRDYDQQFDSVSDLVTLCGFRLILRRIGMEVDPPMTERSIQIVTEAAGLDTGEWTAVKPIFSAFQFASALRAKGGVPEWDSESPSGLGSFADAFDSISESCNKILELENASGLDKAEIKRLSHLVFYLAELHFQLGDLNPAFSDSVLRTFKEKHTLFVRMVLQQAVQQDNAQMQWTQYLRELTRDNLIQEPFAVMAKIQAFADSFALVTYDMLFAVFDDLVHSRVVEWSDDQLRAWDDVVAKGGKLVLLRDIRYMSTFETH